MIGMLINVVQRVVLKLKGHRKRQPISRISTCQNIHLAVSKLFALLLGLGYQNIYKTPTSAPQCTLIKSLFFAISLSYPHDLFKHVFKSVFQKHLVF